MYSIRFLKSHHSDVTFLHFKMVSRYIERSDCIFLSQCDKNCSNL